MAKPLQAYQRKRDFDATPEPSGKGRRRKGDHALRYCIQKHDASHLHYDLRLELDGTLKSWAIPKGPSLDPKVRRLAVHVEDHPLDYADFEGHIPEGHYGAGDVIVWDRGVWEPEGDPRQAYAKGKLRFRLQGEKLGGVWNLFRTHLAGKKEQWLLVKSNDDQARSEAAYSIVEAQPDSVLSERTLPRKKTKVAPEPHQRAELPGHLHPQLATLFPERLSAISGPKNCIGRIFVDYLRNGLGATTACAYSLRARDGLPVSVWREDLPDIKGADQWHIGNLRERLAEVRQSITARMRKQLGVGQ